MHSTCTQPVCTVIATAHPAPQRWWWALQDLWAGWRAAVQRQRRARALRCLSAATLRDIGLEDEVQPRCTLSALDYERGRW
jgi:uncharacterized protein YjiS (DUF1127 family)